VPQLFLRYLVGPVRTGIDAVRGGAVLDMCSHQPSKRFNDWIQSTSCFYKVPLQLLALYELIPDFIFMGREASWYAKPKNNRKLARVIRRNVSSTLSDWKSMDSRSEYTWQASERLVYTTTKVWKGLLNGSSRSGRRRGATRSRGGSVKPRRLFQD
jgi:hypothetical protein